MAFIEHVLAGLTTAGIITAARNRGSLVLLFANKTHHHVIHKHHKEQHTDHFSRCAVNDCATLQSSLVAE